MIRRLPRKLFKENSYHESSANDAVSTLQLNLLVGDVDLGNAILASLNIAEISDVTNYSLRTTVLFSQRIEMRSGTGTSLFSKYKSLVLTVFQLAGVSWTRQLSSEAGNVLQLFLFKFK